MTTNTRRFGCLAAIAAIALTLASHVVRGSAATAPPLPAAAGLVVNVSSEAQLQTAVQQLASDTTIVLAPGTYRLTATLALVGPLTNVAIRGASDSRDDVVLIGAGMRNAAYGNVLDGLSTGAGVQGITIANLTIRDVYRHALLFDAGTQSPRVYNVRLVDAGEQVVLSNSNGAGGGVNSGIVEYSTIEYTTTSRDDSASGIEVQAGANWIVRNNVFRNIVAPSGQFAGPALLVWKGSRGTVTEGNSFINCTRGIAYGFVDVAGGVDHSGGVVRNNFVYRSSAQAGESGISLFDSPDTQILHNTVFLSGTYGSPIEYRFADTTGVVLTNNLLDGIIVARDGASGTETSNLTGANGAMFVNAAAGDLHLAASATSAIDSGAAVAVTSDWDGQPRPQGLASDIGADERASTAAVYQIGGRVGGTSGTAMAGVTVTLSGTRSQTATTDGSGRYAFAALPSQGTYGVTASKSGYSFSPGSSSYAMLGADQTAADFTGTAAQRQSKLAAAESLSAPSSTMAAESTPAGLVIAAVATKKQSTASTKVAAVLSTTSTNELLLAFVSADGATSGGQTVTGIAGAGLTWQLVRRTNVQLGVSEVWRAFAPSALSNATVTATLSQSMLSSLTIVGFTGADATGANGAGAIGATATANAAAGAPSATLTTTRNNSWVFGVGNDWDGATARTLGPNQVMISQYLAPVGDTLWMQRMTAATAAAGTSVTLNDVAPTTHRYNLTIVEVLPAIASGPAGDTTAPTVALSAPTGGTVSGSAVTISATAADEVAVVGVQMKLDGATLGAEMATAPYDMTWNTMSASDGVHSLTATARDAAGNTTTSAVVSITVTNSQDTTAPAVTLTAPVNGATVTGNAVAVSASATDATGVVGVQFKTDGVNLGVEQSTAPFAATWNTLTLANGSHTVTAIARDAAGNATTATVTVTVNNSDTTAPTATMTAPANGATVTGTSVTVSATASDAIGVVGVQFKLDGVNVAAEDMTSPYGITWTSVGTANGSHTFTAAARDAAGNITTATAVTVTVNNDTTAPTAAITAPIAGATVSGTSVKVSANASDNVRVVGVQFLLDGVNLKTEDTTSPYSVNWNSTTAAKGAHSLSARVRDAAGNVTTTAVVTVMVGNDVAAPAVSMTAPSNGATVSGASVVVSATASDDMAVVGVQFKLDGANLGVEDTTAPYSVAWNASAASGSHTLTAVARDASGKSTTATTVTVTASNVDVTAPAAAMTAPANGATVMGTAVTVSAGASDNVGVAGVQFKLDGINLGVEDTTSPYSVAWNTTATANGSHTLTAVARDAAGNVATAATVTVTVNNGVAATPTTLVFQASTDHATVVSYMFKVFANGADTATATPVSSSDLGKPVPTADGDITVDKAAMFGALAPGSYLATVTAINASQQTQSASIAFTR